MLPCIANGFAMIPLEVAEKYRRHVEWMRRAHPALSDLERTRLLDLERKDRARCERKLAERAGFEPAVEF